MAFWKRKPKAPESRDMAYMADVRAAMVVEATPKTTWAL